MSPDDVSLAVGGSCEVCEDLMRSKRIRTISNEPLLATGQEVISFMHNRMHEEMHYLLNEVEEIVLADNLHLIPELGTSSVVVVVSRKEPQFLADLHSNDLLRHWKYWGKPHIIIAGQEEDHARLATLARKVNGLVYHMLN